MSKNAISYATYTTTGTLSGVVNSQAPENLNELAGAGEQIVKTTEKSNWIAEMFPEWVADGTITIVNGSPYFEGVAVTEMLSFAVLVVSVLMLIVKSIGDLKNMVDRNRINSKEEHLLDLKTKKEENSEDLVD